MNLKVYHMGESYIKIVDLEDDETIYTGATDTDCVIEAMAYYFGCDDVEHEDVALGEAYDPLDAPLERRPNLEDTVMPDEAQWESNFGELPQPSVSPQSPYLDDDYD